MHDTILWMRLKEICDDIISILLKERLLVNIHVSTDMPHNMMAAVHREDQRVDIALNMLFNKDINDVISNLAHELTHITERSDEHGEDFAKKAEAIERTIRRNYIR